MIDDRLREELGALLDGALPDEQAAALRRRLESDAELRREYEELERTVAAVRGLPRAGAPVDLRAGIRACLAEPPPVHRGWFTMPRFAAAAAVLVAASIVFYAVSDRESGVTREPTEARAPRVEAPGVDKTTDVDFDDAARDKVTPDGDLEEVLKREPEAERHVGAPAPDVKVKAKKLDAAPVKRVAEGVKEEAAEKTAGKSIHVDLVRLAETDRTKLADNRVAYLEQLSRLSKEKVQSHMFSFANAADAKAQVLHWNTVTVDAVNLVEANRIAGVLRGWTARESKDINSARRQNGFTSGVARDTGSNAFVSTTLRATPDEMQRIATWLTFVSVPAPAGAKKAAEARDAAGAGRAREEKLRGAPGRAKGAAPQQREYRVVIRYPQPVPPTAPAPAGAKR